MGLKQRLITAFGGVTPQEASTRAAEAHAQGYRDAEDEPPTSVLRRFGYRSLGGGLRGSGIPFEEILDTAWALWQSNPMADRALEIKRDYILGRGFSFQTDDDDLQDILDAFWEDNQLRRRMKEFTLQLFLFGVQCLPVFVREADGRVRLGYIDPAEIEEVVAHPENALEMWAVIVKPTESLAGRAWSVSNEKRVYRIVRKAEAENHADHWITAEQAERQEWEDVMLGSFGLDEYTGTCFYEKVNCVSNEPLGRSDLMQVADGIDQHDETLFALGEREQSAGFFSWDVLMEGADDDAIALESKKLRARPPKRGSVNVHNEKKIWQLLYPDLKQTQSIETANAMQTNVLGGLGIPRHWYGFGDETNRATAAAQGDPTWRSLEHDQDIIRDWITTMLEFARDQAFMAGKWKPTSDEVADTPIDELEERQLSELAEITVIMPEMTSRDLAAVSSAAAALAAALMTAEDQNWISQETATEAWAKIMAEIGVEVDPLEELEAVTGEEEDGLLGQAQTASDLLVKHGVMVEEPVSAFGL